MRRERLDLLGAPIDRLGLAETVALVDEFVVSGSCGQHASVNAAKLVRLQDDDELRSALWSCEVVTADGQPVIWAARLLGRPLPERVAGIDLMEALLARAEERAYRVYLLGARQEVLDAARAELRARHPLLRLVGSHHGYFAPEEEEEVVDQVAASRPDILFVALDTPRKELFLARHRERLGVRFAMGVGGAFDVLAGRRRRAPRWAQRSGLEWLFRLIQEPRRLAGRYLVGNARFIALVAAALAHGRRAEFSKGTR